MGHKDCTTDAKDNNVTYLETTSDIICNFFYDFPNNVNMFRVPIIQACNGPTHSWLVFLFLLHSTTRPQLIFWRYIMLRSKHYEWNFMTSLTSHPRLRGDCTTSARYQMTTDPPLPHYSLDSLHSHVDGLWPRHIPKYGSDHTLPSDTQQIPSVVPPH